MRCTSRTPTCLATVILLGWVAIILHLGCDTTPVDQTDGTDESAGMFLPTDLLAEFSVDLDCGQVDIMKKGFLSTDDGLYFELEVAFNDTGTAHRLLEIRTFKSGDKRGFRATLEDTADNLVWEYQNERDVDAGDYSWSAERTSDDELFFEINITDTSFSEAYEQNHDPAEFYFPTDSVHLVQKTYKQMLDGEPDSLWGDPNDPELTAAIVDELYRFDSFYVRTNTLYDNPEGYMVSQFLINEDIGDWLIEQYPDTVGGEPVYLIDPEWCLLAFECAVIKCPAGGLYNPVCDACVGILVVCVIEAIADAFF